MAEIAFADESGTDGQSKCYGIDVLSLRSEYLDVFEKRFHRLANMYGLVGEAKWKKVDRGYGLINFTLEWLRLILRSRTCRFNAIVVDTARYRLWSQRRANRELAFYKTYTYLLRYVAQQVRTQTDVLIDDRSDKYHKQHEVLETIGNRMLVTLESQGRLTSVRKVKSTEHPGVQVADLLTGAITASHSLLMNPAFPLNAGKRLLISRLAEYLGWDALHYDTRPHSRFNIWHFPLEYRATPETKLVNAVGTPRFVTPEEVTHAT